MSSNPVISSAGRALTPGAVALMLMLCLSWGFNQIAVKLVLPDVPPMLQALTRSLGAWLGLPKRRAGFGQSCSRPTFRGQQCRSSFRWRWPCLHQ